MSDPRIDAAAALIFRTTALDAAPSRMLAKDVLAAADAVEAGIASPLAEALRRLVDRGPNLGMFPGGDDFENGRAVLAAFDATREAT